MEDQRSRTDRRGFMGITLSAAGGGLLVGRLGAAGGDVVHASPCDWTIMLYLCGDNNLSEDMIRALSDIKIQGVPENVAVTVQYDPRAPGFKTSRYAIPRKETTPTAAAHEQPQFELLPIPEYLVRTLPNEDSSDPHVLADFIRWSATEYPSKYRMLILSGHGSGAVGDFLSDENAHRGEPGSLTIPRLGKAFELAQAGHASEKGALAKPLDPRLLESSGEPRLLHIVGMDSCLMGMAEMCHQVRDWADYIVGSEGFVPNAGWPYAHLLKQLASRKEDRKPENMVSWVVDDVLGYYDQYIPGGVSFDMAACDVKKLPQVAEAVERLTAILSGYLKRDELSDLDEVIRDLVIVSHWRAQSYKFEQHTDLWDFCDQLEKSANRSGRAVLAQACNNVKESIEAAVTRNGHSGAEFQHSHGLSVYFPWSASPFEEKALTHYAQMSFPQESGWAEFLKAYLTSTQRQGRPKPEQASFYMERFRREGLLQAYGPGKAAEGANRYAEGANRYAEGANRAAEGTNRYAEGANRAAEGANRLMMRLISGPGMTLPGSMKNPPNGVWISPRRPVPEVGASGHRGQLL